MGSVVPEPEPEDVAFNEPVTVDLDPAQRATVTFTPEQSGSTFYLHTLAVSKVEGTIYEVRDDDTEMYGPASVPPTDIDDLTVCWRPAKQFSRSLEVVIVNNSESEQTYHVQPVGHESIGGGPGGS